MFERAQGTKKRRPENLLTRIGLLMEAAKWAIMRRAQSASIELLSGVECYELSANGMYDRL